MERPLVKLSGLVSSVIVTGCLRMIKLAIQKKIAILTLLRLKLFYCLYLRMNKNIKEGVNFINFELEFESVYFDSPCQKRAFYI